MIPLIEMLESFFESSWAFVLFSAIVLGSFALLILAALFFLLVVQSIWHWLSRSSWPSTIAAIERKALR